MSNRIYKFLDKYICAYMHGTQGVETQNALIIIGLGLWILSFDMFDSCPHIYIVLLSVARQNTWGIVFMSIGVAHIVIIEHGTARLRKWTLLIQGALWVFLLYTAVISEWRSPGVPVYFVLALSAFRGFLCIRLSNGA